MFNKNALIIDINQRITFSKIFAKTQRSSRVFLPGCSLASLGTEIIDGTLELLKREMPDIALSSFCCGKPSTHIDGGKDFAMRFGKLEQSLQSNGVKQVVTACPNCYNLLASELKDIEVLSIWSVLDKIIVKNDLDYGEKEMILHDPCVTRNCPKEHESVRSILSKINVRVVEFKQSKDKTTCCGQKNMLMVLNKEKAMIILKHRVDKAGKYEVVSYCSACVQAFKSQGKISYHILELLLKKEGNYSAMNRLAIANKLNKV